jgi:hypothetical protein
MHRSLLVRLDSCVVRVMIAVEFVTNRKNREPTKGKVGTILKLAA